MSISYREDIDGLRALAVSLVIFNHIGLSLFAGGYIGVDVFFVISGYLITAILVKDSLQHQFSISSFYKKRIIRLAPALLSMLLVVTLISCMLMLPHELENYFKSLNYAIFFMANVFMREEVGDYFSLNTDQIPLLHLWSLGVEEQFYIFWPLCLLFLLKRVPIKWMSGLVLSLIVLLIINAEMAMQQNIAKAYFAMPVRAFELLVGALVCFLPKHVLQDKWASYLVWLGLITILVSAVCMGHSTHFPGLMALIPCMATALIIYVGGQTAHANPLLVHKWSTWIGKISYPMYLWHWPLIVFLNIYLLSLNALNQVLIVLSTVLLAYASYRWIELPCRRFSRTSSTKVILIGFLIPALTITASAHLVEIENGFPNRFEASVQQHSDGLISYAHEIRGICHNGLAPNQLAPTQKCILGVDKPQIDFMLIGDSHANHFTGMLDVWAKDAGLRGYDATQDTTIFLPHVDLYIPNQTGFTLDTKFRARNDALIDYLQTHHFNQIVLAGYFENYLRTYRLNNLPQASSAQLMFNSLNEAMPILFKSANEVMIILDTPTLTGRMHANCPVRAEALGRHVSCDFALQHDPAMQQFAQIMQQLQQRYPQLKVIDPKVAQCKSGHCSASIQGVALYRDQDNNHLNYRGSEALGRAYLQQHPNPLGR